MNTDDPYPAHAERILQEIADEARGILRDEGFPDDGRAYTVTGTLDGDPLWAYGEAERERLLARLDAEARARVYQGPPLTPAAYLAHWVMMSADIWRKTREMHDALRDYTLRNEFLGDPEPLRPWALAAGVFAASLYPVLEEARRLAAHKGQRRGAQLTAEKRRTHASNEFARCYLTAACAELVREKGRAPGRPALLERAQQLAARDGIPAETITDYKTKTFLTGD